MNLELDRRVLAIATAELLAASFVVLFQELTLIRWLGSEIRALAYFPNLILMSTFLGLGIGCLLVRAPHLIKWWPASLALVVIVTQYLKQVVFTLEGQSTYLWLLYDDMPKDAPVIDSIVAPIMIFFVVSGLSFIPLGQYVAERLEIFRSQQKVLLGYCCDIGGSILGVIAFAAVGFAQLPPVAWFSIIVLLGLFLLRPSKPLIALHLSIGSLIIGAIFFSSPERLYSPYYTIKATNTLFDTIKVSVNGSLHQIALGFDEARIDASEYIRDVENGYRKPYRWFGRTPESVLILGAGTGNDVAIALKEGVKRIDAVEIDPVILEIGERRHPDRPYDSEHVRVFNTDARSFLNESKSRYDLIIFATLDSMTRLSALSNVRLDNFVYTQESINLARDHLTSEGGIVLYFAVGQSSIHNRLYGLLAESFGRAPFFENAYHHMFNHTYAAGPAFEHKASNTPEQVFSYYEEFIRPAFEPPSDDWPYLYLQSRGIGGFYLSVIISIVLLSALGVFGAMRTAARADAIKFDPQLFFFGLGFLLLETRGVTAMSLMWGATWVTSAVVFGAVLLMVLLATVAVQLKLVGYKPGIIGLVISLVAVYFAPVGQLLSVAMSVKLFWSIVIVGAPVFFASVCFAHIFQRRSRPGAAFGWNILGAVCGGLLEFCSMAVGLRQLLLIALAAYLIALFAEQKAGRIAPELPH